MEVSEDSPNRNQAVAAAPSPLNVPQSAPQSSLPNSPRPAGRQAARQTSVAMSEGGNDASVHDGGDTGGGGGGGGGSGGAGGGQRASSASPAPKLSSTGKAKSSSARPFTADAVGHTSNKQSALETRNTVRDYIRNERDTSHKKWMQLSESLNAEDIRREEFLARRLKNISRVLPLQVQKLIGNLKRAVHNTMREKGGTPFSILRQLFIYWDSCKNGSLSLQDFKSCLHSLGLVIPADAVKDIFQYYSHSDQDDARMGYAELLGDIQKDEPTILEIVDLAHEDNAIRFAEAADDYAEMPKKVKQFIEAIRSHISDKMRDEGGTMYYHARKIFQNYDFNYSSGLDPQELLVAGHRNFHLSMTLQDAQEIVKYYDRKKVGEMNHLKFVDDVCRGLTSILEFQDLSARGIADQKRSLQANPFMKKKFRAPSSKLVEKIKERIRESLELRVHRQGGSYKSWVIEAFKFWDPKGLGKFTSWTQMQGAVLRLGVSLSEDEARAMMSCFDEFKNGEVYYEYAMASILEEEPSFLDTRIVTKTGDGGSSSRAPKVVELFLRKLRTAIDIFIRKSKGTLEPRNILHGTFLRFDGQRSGRVSQSTLVAVSKELGVTLRPADAAEVVGWFDSDGSGSFDYNELTRQLCGEDVLTRAGTTTKFEHSSAGGSSVHGASTLGFRGSMTTVVPGESRASKALQLTAMQAGVSDFNTLTGKFGSSAAPRFNTSLSASLPEFTTTTMLMSMDEPNKDKKYLVETRLIKQARKKVQRQLLVQEKSSIHQRLDSIEKQRRKIIEDHRLRSAQKARAAALEQKLQAKQQQSLGKTEAGPEI